MKNKNIDPKKKLILTIISIIFYITFFFILVILIWNPKKGNGISKYSDEIDYYEQMSKVYLGKLRRVLLTSNTDGLYELMNKEYMSQNNLTKDNFKEFLIKKRLIGETINIYEYTYSESSSVSVFIFKYRSMGFERVVNVIETKPYEYTISFEQNSIPGINNTTKTEKNGLSITVQNTGRTSSQINYKIKIKNNNEQKVGIDLTTIYNVSLLMSDGNYVNMSSSYTSSDIKDVIETNETIEKDVIFLIPSSYHGDIKALLIKDVDFNGKKIDIQVTF